MPYFKKVSEFLLHREPLPKSKKILVLQKHFVSDSSGLKDEMVVIFCENLNFPHSSDRVDRARSMIAMAFKRD